MPIALDFPATTESEGVDSATTRHTSAPLDRTFKARDSGLFRVKQILEGAKRIIHEEDSLPRATVVYFLDNGVRLVSDSVRNYHGVDKLEVLRSLDEASRLPRNWDGYGAAPIDPVIIERAKLFVLDLGEESVPTPAVVPMTRGRLQLEWHRGRRSLELEFENPTTIHYLKWDPDAGVEEEDVLSPTQTKELHDLLSWFVSE